jgi:hypothetical protein
MDLASTCGSVVNLSLPQATATIANIQIAESNFIPLI